LDVLFRKSRLGIGQGISLLLLATASALFLFSMLLRWRHSSVRHHTLRLRTRLAEYSVVFDNAQKITGSIARLVSRANGWLAEASVINRD